MKDSFYEEVERVFDKFPKYHHMKILLGDFNANVNIQDENNDSPNIIEELATGHTKDIVINPHTLVPTPSTTININHAQSDFPVG
jgi:hypothetical protein